MDNNNYPKTNTPKQHKVSLREQKKNRVMMAIAATFTLLLILFTVLLCTNVIMEIRGRTDDTPDDDPAKDGEQNTGEDETPDGDTPTTPTYDSVSMPASAVGEGSLILVNASHVYKFPANPSLVNVYLEQETAKTRGVYFQLAKQLFMEQTAYQAMNKMLTAFSEQSGLSNVLMADAYRSFEQQQALGSSTAAGYSDSHTGLSCALRVSTGGKTSDLSSSSDYDWIYQNCHKYGFVVRYPLDKATQTGVSDYDYYFRYVGYPHAYAMKTKNLCLEEYLTSLRNYSVDAPMQLTTDDGSIYDIYYVTATGSETPIPVEQGASYTISGDNDSGFVVTVKRS